MKKLTAGIMTVMLGLVMADANAAITSKKYVDDAVKAVDGRVTTLNTEVTEFKEGITTTITDQIKTELTTDTSDIAKALAGKAAASDVTALTTRVATAEDDIDALEAKVGNAEGGLIKDVAGLQADVAGLTTGDNSVDSKIEMALGDYTTTEDLEGTYATKEALNTEATTRKDADDAIKATIGELPEGVTSVAAGLTTLQTSITNITSSETGILKDANDYTDSKVGTIAEGKTAAGLIKDNADAIAAMDEAYKAADTELTTAVEKAQADATKALNESIQKVSAENDTGDFVLTMKKGEDGSMTFQWENISRTLDAAE